MRKQSPADHAARLAASCCPVHGIPMYQAGIQPGQKSAWFQQYGGKMDGADYTIVECTRKNCGIRAKAFEPFGPAELLPESVERVLQLLKP